MPGSSASAADGSNGNIKKTSYMVKRSQGKSALGAMNFKKRVFVLTDTKLLYYDGTLEKRGSQKGCVDLRKVKVIEKVADFTFEKPSFQVMHGDLILYVICNNAEEQSEWIRLIQEQVKECPLLADHYHPGTFSSGRWTCCEHRSKYSTGCKATFKTNSVPASPTGPVISLPTTPSSMLSHDGISIDGPNNFSHSNFNGTSASFKQRRLPPLPDTPQEPPALPKKPPVIPPHKPNAPNYHHNTIEKPPPPITSKPLPQLPVNQRPLPSKPVAKRSPYEHQAVQQSSPQQTMKKPPVKLPTPTPPAPPAKPELPKQQTDSFDVIAMYDYSAPESGDLPLVKGERLTIFESQRAHWWKARNKDNREGYVPANYVKRIGLESEEWFFPDLSRTRTETVLVQEGKEGGFVVRNSSRPGMYTLSICHDSQVRHYHIKIDDEKKYYISEKHRFPTITELIDYHRHNGGGLVTRLRKPPAQLLPIQQSLSSVLDDKWEIDRNELTLGKEIGSGQFGRVVEGKWNGATPVAIKMMKEGAMNEDDFIEEAQVMKNFTHPNLVKLYGVCSQHGPIYIVTELMKHGALLQYLRNKHDLITKTDVILDMALQICSAMQFLEEIKFIHRDLAARNCLVGERNCVKVGDFGLARFVVDDEYTASEGTKFPIKWAAPEVITHARFSSKSDVWSYGILMWELWTGGKTPYPTFTNPQVLDEVLRGYRLERPYHCPQEVYELMKSCWKEHQEDRPIFKDLYLSLKELAGDERDYSDPIND